MTDLERDLLTRAAAWPGHNERGECTHEAMRVLAGWEGIDFATALLYERVRRLPEHAGFIERIESYDKGIPTEQHLDATLVIVPGAFYREFPQSGADGRLVREEAAHFHCPSDLIPLPSFGSLSETAQLICEWLDTQREGPIILVSLSKGGADIKASLARPGAEYAFRNVVAWVNLCGLLDGTSLANWALECRWRSLWFRLFFWFRGYPFATIHDLVRKPGSPLDFPLSLPAHVRLISVVGFPLRCHLTNRLARRCHRRIESLGPNDAAGILLADVCTLPGLVYPMWGADHYLRPGGIEARGLVRRILAYLSEELRASTLTPQASRS